MDDPDAREALRAAYALPDWAHLVLEDGLVLAWRAAPEGDAQDAEAAVRRVAADPDALPRAEATGRAPLARLAREQGRPILVRPYRKGGMLRGLRGTRFRGRLRPLDELALHGALQARRVPVLEVTGAVVRGDEQGWEGFLLTREETGARDLGAWLDGADVAGHDDPQETLARAGRAVRALHDAGVAHPDLHPGNLLLTTGGAVLVIDLDRARMGPAALAEDARLANLARLERWLVKQRRQGRSLPRWDPAPFYRGYAGDEAGSWSRRALDRRGSLRLRALWWRLTGQTSGKAGA